MHLLFGKLSTNENPFIDYILPEENFDLAYLGSIAPINILVGANNSGKSRFMRTLLKRESYSIIKNNSFNTIIKAYDVLKNTSNSNNKPLIFTISHQGDIKTTDESFFYLNDNHKTLYNKRSSQRYNIDQDFFTKIKTIIESAIHHPTNLNDTHTKQHIDPLIDIISVALEISKVNFSERLEPQGLSRITSYTNAKRSDISLFETLINGLKSIKFHTETKHNLKRTYIPILRSARTLFDSKSLNRKEISEIFKNTITQTYNLVDKNIRIETGLDLYSTIKRSRNERRETRQLFDEFEKFLSETFFQGRDFEIVARDVDKIEEEHLTVRIGEIEQDIHNLGDGIQSLIMLLYPIFTAEKNSWIFIEEPEINLHPGLQRIFLDTIKNNLKIKQKQLTIFLTTHSNHLLDITLESENNVSIFTFTKLDEASKTIVSVAQSHDIDILSLLGVHNSSVFMANSSVWVEGPTDRIYIRGYIKAYMDHHHPKKSLVEDLHFSFFEYAGSNITHYLFTNKKPTHDRILNSPINSLFLANKIFLISDTDSGKDNRHKYLLAQQNKNFTYHNLPVREIENLLTPENIYKYLPQSIINLKETDLTKNPIKYTDYKNEYLASFLQKHYTNIIPKTVCASSGTFTTYYKDKIARQVSKEITWAEMSTPAKQMTKKLVAFIAQHNPQLSITA